MIKVIDHGGGEIEYQIKRVAPGNLITMHSFDDGSFCLKLDGGVLTPFEDNQAIELLAVLQKHVDAHCEHLDVKLPNELAAQAASKRRLELQFPETKDPK